MLLAEWTIIARQAVLRLAQMKYKIFCPRTLQAERVFFRYKPSKQVIYR